MRNVFPDRDCKRIPEPTAADGLPPGRWMQRRGIRVWVEARLPAAPAPTHMTTRRMVVAGVLCDDCGCLLLPGERCPACLVWAIRDAERWSWAQQRKDNHGRIWAVHRKRSEVAQMSHETDQAFLENYTFMLSTGESHETAATRFGVSANTLQRRVERVRLRVVDDPGMTGGFGRMVGTTKAAPAVRKHCDPGPDHRQGWLHE